MSLNVSVGGIRAANKRLEVAGNNIANVGTVGFKSSRAEFSALYSSAHMSNGRSAVGDGVRLANVSQNFNQGTSMATHGRPLDMRIQGNGFFVVSDGGALAYTRAGAFLKDADDFIVDSEGGRLQGYAVSDTGEVIAGVRTDLKMDTSAMAPKSTTRVSETINLDASLKSLAALPVFDPLDPSTYTRETVRTIQDKGIGSTPPADHELKQYFVKTDEHQWSMYVLIDGRNPVDPSSTRPLHVTLNQAPDGKVTYSGNADHIKKVSDTEFSLIGWKPARQTGGSWSASAAPNDGAVSLSLLDGSASTLNENDPVMARPVPLFDAADIKTYNSVFPTAIYDSQGNQHLLKQYFIKDGPNSWQMQLSVNDRNPVDPSSKQPLTASVVFNTDGSLRSITGSAGLMAIGDGKLQIQGWVPAKVRDQGTGREQWFSNGAVAGADGITLDMSKLSQYNVPTSRTSPQADGHAAGQLVGLNLERDGTLQARFNNGLSRNIGQVMLASFANEQGLQAQSGTRWTETNASGIANYGNAGVGTMGSIVGGALEGSNVELSEELVELIQAQTAYQANSKAISTEVTVLQALMQSI
ncbi:flagellar hook-basal body complex protein [Pseudomonas sp. DWP3-1-2]|uniref:flagellar hook-basal body complex protein n=1 Tax=Pseudomonas sp. DWP3-1-2 TaxID=2804645 RepID=UPI003CE91CA6